ncbi:ATP-binding cassette domain-containing protein [Pseudomonas aeruginosa]|uniref:ATP-binding cassette domain-containing protein n=1 Tax=Pseudomonas aeruginosa TaxID=287 RepID=UPI0027DE6BDA|nr:ATP-binding cassette domain-containing protein [Pseudomonas aeruginosa]
MEEVGLDNPRALLKRYPFEMSGGMLQRMMVALALLSRAPFIIADEPTTDLDAIAQARILDLLADIVASRSRIRARAMDSRSGWLLYPSDASDE